MLNPSGLWRRPRRACGGPDALQGAFAGRTAECVGLAQPALGSRLHARLVDNRRDGRTQHVAVDRSVPNEVIGFGDRP